MRESIHPESLTRSRRARLLTVATLVSGALVAGCGGSSGTDTAAPVVGASSTALSTPDAGATAKSRTATSAATTSSGRTAPDASLGLAFAKCIRSSGVPNFPDPNPGGGFLFPVRAGVNPASPAVRAARAKCQKLLPGGGPPGPGSTTHPSAQTLARLVRIAQCMREHGISQFPDPRTSVPSNVAGIDDITDFDGVILLFPATLNLQAPAYKRALAACGAPPLGLPH